MKHAALALPLLAVLLLAVGLALPNALRRALPTSPPIYPLATVQAGLQRQPRAWLGRTIYLRGVRVGWATRGSPVTVNQPPQPSARCIVWLSLAAADTPTLVGAFQVFAPPHVAPRPAPADGLAAPLRALPLIGPLFPRPAGSVYYVRLTRACPALPLPCYSAVLVP